MTELIPFADSDLLIKAWVSRSDIQLLCKYVEGMGHLGVVTTTDRLNGEVVIQTTRHCWPDLKILLTRLPLSITFLNEDNLEIIIGKNNHFLIDE